MGAALVYYWVLVLDDGLGEGLVHALCVASFLNGLLVWAAEVPVV